MAKGNILEKLIAAYKDSRVVLERQHDAQRFGQYHRVSVCSDFFGNVSGRATLLEAKETESEAIPYSKLRRKQSSHQMDALIRWQECHPDAISGYIVRVKEDIGFIPIRTITEDRGSITSSHPGRWQKLSEPLNVYFLLTGAK